jgi:hypothetical protein
MSAKTTDRTPHVATDCDWSNMREDRKIVYENAENRITSITVMERDANGVFVRRPYDDHWEIERLVPNGRVPYDDHCEHLMPPPTQAKPAQAPNKNRR